MMLSVTCFSHCGHSATPNIPAQSHIANNSESATLICMTM